MLPQLLYSSLTSLVLNGALALGWVIAFISLCIVSSTVAAGLVWWTVLAWLVLILAYFVAIMSSTLNHYRAMLTALGVYVMSITTTSVSLLIGSSLAAALSTAAGLIIMSIAGAAVLILLTVHEQSSLHQFIATFGEGAGARGGAIGAMRGSASAVGTKAGTGNTLQRPLGSGITSPVMSATSHGGGAPTHSIDMPSPPHLAGTAITSLERQQQQQQGVLASPGANPVQLVDSIPIVFEYRARALYAYAANPEDPQEISFDKDEELEVANPHGNKWWQCKKTDGTVGIAPSNYLQLVS